MASYGGGRQGKSFIVTLGIGIFFGFGFAYMILQSNGPLNLPPPDASQQVIIIKWVNLLNLILKALFSVY